jgi:hypothetical protein
MALGRWHGEALIDLREILARLYPTERDARRVATEAGLNTGLIALEGTSIMWRPNSHPTRRSSSAGSAKSMTSRSECSVLRTS